MHKIIIFARAIKAWKQRTLLHTAKNTSMISLMGSLQPESLASNRGSGDDAAVTQSFTCLPVSLMCTQELISLIICALKTLLKQLSGARHTPILEMIRWLSDFPPFKSVFLFSGSDLKCIFTDLCINYTCTLSSDSKHKKQQVKDVHDAQKCHCKFFDMLDKNAENKKKPCNIRAGYLLDIWLSCVIILFLDII